MSAISAKFVAFMPSDGTDERYVLRISFPEAMPVKAYELRFASHTAPQTLAAHLRQLAGWIEEQQP